MPEAAIRRAIDHPRSVRPPRQIAINAGYDGDLAVETIKESKGAEGLNAATGEFSNLVKDGIIDPAQVAKAALIHASSVAGLMLTTECLVTELKDDTKAEVGAVA